MALNCGHSTIKYLLFIFNLLWSLCGIALVAYGALLKESEKTFLGYKYVLNPESVIFIVLGSIMFIISFFGCCGAIRESYCMTLTYSFLLILIIIVQIVLAVLGLQDRVQDQPREKNDVVVAWLFIGIAIVELLGVISGCCLANAIRNSGRRTY